MSSPKRLAQSQAHLKQIMDNYYTDNHTQAKSGKFVVWPAILAPVELFRGFDITVAPPENHAAMCAIRGLGAQQAEKAEKSGYSMDLCSYPRIDLGTVIDNGRGSPSMGLPKPDLLVSDNHHCSLLVKWFDVHHREMGVPHFILDVPFCYEPQKDKDLNYILHQLHDLIDLLEELTGCKFDMEKVREAVRLTNEANKHWKRFYDFAAHRPSGITAFDSFVHMAPYITHRGTPTLVEHFKLLADEIEEHIADGLFPIPEEKYRLLWDNIAPWHQIRKMSGRLSEMKANINYASYTSCIGTKEGEVEWFPMEDPDPLRNLARVQNAGICAYGLELRWKSLREMIEKFRIDGVIFTSNCSCKVYSIMQMDLQRRVKEKYNLPTVMIDVDHADARKYNESNVLLQIEALLEQIDEQRH